MALGNAAFFDNGHDGYFMLDVYHDFWGFDEPRIIGSNVSGLVNFPFRNRATPMMSYAPGDRWISPFSYCLLLNRSGISCDAQTITQRYLKADEVKRLVAQLDAAWQWNHLLFKIC